MRSFPASRLNPSSPATFPWISRIVCSAVNWRRVDLATTRGSGARLACPVPGLGGLVATLLAPQGRRVSVHPRHGFSVCSHRYSSPPPSLIPRVPGVSTILAERDRGIRSSSARRLAEVAGLGQGSTREVECEHRRRALPVAGRARRGGGMMTANSAHRRIQGRSCPSLAHRSAPPTSQVRGAVDKAVDNSGCARFSTHGNRPWACPVDFGAKTYCLNVVDRFRWMRLYTQERPHSALDERTPSEAYRWERAA